MFRGEKINITENRAVLHVAQRAPRGATIVVDGENVVPQVHAVLHKMADFSNRVRSGEWKGHSGKRIRNVRRSAGMADWRASMSDRPSTFPITFSGSLCAGAALPGVVSRPALLGQKGREHLP
jgi:hypothetical protein